MKDYKLSKIKFGILRYQKLIIASIIVGFLSALLSDGLKKLTEHYEEIFFGATKTNWLFNLLFPVFGLTIIYFLRHFLFKNKQNKGIKEIFETIKTRHNELPIYKIPSHFINGLLTVVFGGSSGIEVSTVVASATIGSVAQKKDYTLKGLKTELICAGVAAGITALFNSPVAGILFAIEVISKKISPTFIISTTLAVATAFGFTYIMHDEPLFILGITTWHTYALPYIILLGVIAGLNSVYMTKSVLFFKRVFSKFRTNTKKIVIGSLILSAATLAFPQLYGDGYHSVKELLLNSQHAPLTLSFAFTLVGVLILKPLVTSATLAAGGDGGVFGPSLLLGAFLGLFMAAFLNTFFSLHVIPVNFMAIGMAAVLSASVHAPFTAIFLVCGIIGNYILFIPILIACLISKLTAKMVFPFTVYSYNGK